MRRERARGLLAGNAGGAFVGGGREEQHFYHDAIASSIRGGPWSRNMGGSPNVRTPALRAMHTDEKKLR